ncbi:hypothetical protein Ocin01_09976 [Orchesella cincta]|uniref:MARVEL domain-containing protein n=1 Tax=Orchesella cincta TaxID=48709 RepID=A0A1D2MUI1_ORCCI|nr:hypothetical protein Ocin01_09976 [Orchesella cincta]
MSCLTGVYVFIALVELVSGLVASVWTAFYNDKEVDEWAYGIFAFYLAFAHFLLYASGRQTFCRGHFNSDHSTALNVICWMSSVITIFLFTGLYYYNKKVLGHKTQNKLMIYPFIAYIVAIALFFVVNVAVSMEKDIRTQKTYRSLVNPAPGSIDASLARMVEHVRRNPP